MYSEMFSLLPDEAFSKQQREAHPLEEPHTLTQELARAIHTLWTEHDIRAATSSLDKSAPYFLDRILHIGSPDYIPTDSDILRCKIHAPPPMEEVTVAIGERDACSLVCPRQSLATKHKWLPWFEGISVLLVLINLDDYDRPVRFPPLSL